ncbi:hypothetical protein K457DRAFT_442875 [Linnemannia elongata AG-77]|uniref:Transmembrane protein n=1 Tax=Linnemannia elongata AG-77 TaxID=1314771 RepID=A0A197K1M2_9FUNG|nr:hypothetical protein K457DRAFT_442875 [Linnemannia elongata AG-77]
MINVPCCVWEEGRRKKNTSSSEANTCTTNVHTKKRVGCSNKGGSCMLIARMSTSVNTDSFHCILSPFFVSSLVISSFFYALLHRQRNWVRDASLLCALSYQTLIPLPGLRERQHRSKSSKHIRHILLYKKRSQRRNLSHMHFSSAFLLFCLNRQKRRVLFHANLFVDCLKWVIVHWAS